MQEIKDMIYWYVLPAIIMTFVLFAVVVSAHAEPLKASWYSSESLIKEGTRGPGEKQIMANGKEFDENKSICATRLYSLGTWLKITNTKNGKSIEVLVCDRVGKRFAKTRIDLAKSAFQKIASLKEGLIPITVEVLDGQEKTRTQAR